MASSLVDLLLVYLLLLNLSLTLQTETAAAAKANNPQIGTRKKANPQITVMGMVYCDICSNNSFSRHSYFLPGAQVKIDCKFQAVAPRTTEQISFSVNRTTNKHGIYTLEVPSVDGIQCARDKAVGNSCRASLMGTSSASCNVPSFRTTTDEFSIKAKQANMCIYSLTALTFRPSQRDAALCGN